MPANGPYLVLVTLASLALLLILILWVKLHAFLSLLLSSRAMGLAVGMAPDKVLKLQDQFGSDEVKLRLPLYFAVPVTKRHGDKTHPIHNKGTHLLIFSITTRDLQKTIKLRNQFTRGTSVRVVRSLMLGAPSLKLEWKPL